MKKFSVLIIMICVIAINTITAFAGDLPESLLSENGAQVFFGVLIEAEPFSDNFKSTVKPVKKIKGDITIDAEVKYESSEFVGEFMPKRGNVYLFAFLDESNPVFVFEIDSYDTASVKIKGTEKNDMWSRFSEYINEGKFEEAEKERLKSLGIEETKWQSDNLPDLKNFNMEIYALISIGVAVVAFIIYTKVSKKRL